MLWSRSAFALLAAFSLAAAAPAQLAWQQQLATPSPLSRHESALSFDPVGGGLVLFGGSSNQGELGDTWRWTGTAWQQLSPVTAPAARYGPRLATDTNRDVVVLFGGLTFNYNAPTGPYVPLNDTWEWNGANWLQRTPVNNPPARYGHAMAYDPVRERVVMFGGMDSASQFLADTWEWDGVDWALRVSATPMVPQMNHSMAWDGPRSVVLMADGIVGSSRGTWQWNGTTWTFRGPCPNGFGARLAFDDARERVVWYGGADNNGFALPIGVWEWNGQAWAPRPTAVSPPPRFWHQMAFDPATEEIVVFGGRDDSQPALQQRKDDTWSLAPVYRATTTSFGAGCPGTVGVPAIGTADRPWLGTTVAIDWTNAPAASVVLLAFGWSRADWLGVPLPLPLDAIGMTGCSLLVAPELAVARATIGGFVQQDVALPYVAAVLGFELSLQGFGFDAAANPAGLVASNGLALRLGGL